MVTWAISTLWTFKISPQQVVGIQVIYTTRPSSVCLWHLKNESDSNASRFSVCYTPAHLDPPTPRFQLTRRIARSLGDSWASCILKSSAHSYMSLAVAWADGWRSVRTSMRPFLKLLWPFVRLLLTAYCHFLATLRQPLFGVFLFLHCPSLPPHLKN